jgi:hypothetical protein
MADPELSTAAAAIAAGTIGGVRPPTYYGGGPAIPTGPDGHFILFVLDYLNRHPQERSGLTDELRELLKPHNPAPGGHYMPLIRHFYPQGSIALDAQLAAPNLVYTHATHHCDFGLLEAHRSDVASLARFSQRVDHATFYLFVAVDTALARSAWHTPGVKIRRSPKNWYGALAQQCFARWKTTRNLLVHDWAVPVTSEPLYRTAFWSLCELTPADSQLKLLFEQDRLQACQELVKHVDAYADQLALATDLAETMAASDAAAEAGPKARLDEIQQSLLAKAGDRLTLTEAAERLGITRQALHKKIKTGAALGLMIGDTFVLPAAQLVEGKSGTAVVAHLRDVLSLFTEAGAGDWSALQYLIEPDPVLGALPLDRLKAGDAKPVVAAARAYLGLDEG